MGRPKPKRILLKLSGEALVGEQSFGIDDNAVRRFASEIAQVSKSGTEVAIVIGGGNIFRGMAIAARGGDRVTGDHMGMLATVMNALALEAALVHEGVDARAMSAIEMPSICETYIHRRAAWHMNKGLVVVLAGGTGNPFFTTDSGAALRALELECDALLKGTQVDGVYTADPRLDAGARKYDRVSYEEAIAKGLAVMDTAAFALARDNRLPIIVFNIHEAGALARIVAGEAVGTLVSAN
ncbi:UMP kinase [Propylenella binzhouense]|uniref:Uridylate kinase n=1 Tax=Propylenella binzhouense TaxID=2555902 RepID=A0A964WT81_9HYPH|nr:UMP kinase [Propylenella binzhouense]MYZ47733.1 UMP kinase [Propylenella binzhouense]